MDRPFTALLAFLVLAGIGFTLAAWVLGIFSLDLAVEQALQGRGVTAGMRFMAWISLPGDGWIPVVLVVAVSALCLIRGRRLEALFVIGTLGSTLFSGILKILVARPRPPGVPIDLTGPLHAFNMYAYPSGHVIFYVVFFGFLAYLSWIFIRGPARPVVPAVCLFMIGLIGPSRVILGDHWVSDAIGGYLIGAAWVVLMIILYQGIRTIAAGRQVTAP